MPSPSSPLRSEERARVTWRRDSGDDGIGENRPPVDADDDDEADAATAEESDKECGCLRSLLAAAVNANARAGAGAGDAVNGAGVSVRI